MSKVGKRLLRAAKSAHAIARGEADPATYRVHAQTDGLDVVVEAMDLIEDGIKNLPMKAKIDLGARIRAIMARAEAIDDTIKADIHQELHYQDGVLRGGMFSAQRSSYAATRVDQRYLEAHHPRIYRKCLKTSYEARILFQAR